MGSVSVTIWAAEMVVAAVVPWVRPLGQARLCSSCEGAEGSLGMVQHLVLLFGVWYRLGIVSLYSVPDALSALMLSLCSVPEVLSVPFALALMLSLCSVSVLCPWCSLCP